MASNQSSFGEQIEEYEVLNLLGKGGFASVYRAKCSKSGLEVAIKMIDKKLMKAAGMVERVRQEVAIHSRLKHPAILELYTFFEDSNYVYLVLELCHNGELQRYLKNSNKIICEEDACHTIRQVVEGLLYLHSHNILHRDMTLANLLLTKDMQVKIADFGLATQLTRPDEKHLTMCGTPNYISPEVATRSSHGLEADVWGVGCMLYTLLVGRPPFDTDAVKSTLTRVVMDNYQLPCHLSVEARDLIDLLLKKNPKERIKLREILEHPFMKKNQKNYEYLQKKWMVQGEDDSGMCTMSTDAYPGKESIKSGSASSKFDPVSGNIISLYSEQLGRVHISSRDEANVSSLPKLGNGRAKDSCGAMDTCMNSHHGVNKMEGGSVHCPSEHEPLLVSRCGTLSAHNTCVNSQQSNHTSHVSGCCASSNPTLMSRGHTCHSICQGCSNHEQLHCLKTSLVINSENPEVFRQPAQNCGRSCYSDGLLSCRMANNGRKNGVSECGATESRWKSSHSCSCPNKDCHDSMFSNMKTSLTHQHFHHKWPDPDINDHAHEVKHDVLQLGLFQNSCGVPNDKISCSENGGLREDSKVQRRVKEDPQLSPHLNGLAPPLTTHRLQPTRHRTKNAVLSILDSGEVCIEFVKKRSGEEKVVEVCRISADGMRVVLYHPNNGKGCLLENAPPDLPKQGTDAIYSYESLPQKHWRKYLYASRFVCLVKAKTPKVTFYSEKAKCLLMENSPDPDFEVCFYEGGKVVKSGDEVKVLDSSGRSTSFKLNQKDYLPIEVSIMWRHFEQCYKHCTSMEKNLSDLTTLDGEQCFPIIVGRRPRNKNVFRDKENVASNSVTLSPPNGMFQSFETSSMNSMLVNPSCVNGGTSVFKSHLKPVRDNGIVEPVKQVHVPNIGLASQFSSGDLRVEYLDGSQITISSSKATTDYIDKDGRKVLYQHKDLLPFHVREKLALMPKVIDHLMNGQEKRSNSKTRGIR
ncbi:serine/threonine-protein kinase PLK4 [Ischnura elegans]|uniref:serine/threonine-protein kinase PLK4 n=1 Tax=Ischnura elegans TaxID=197161 RepID=UPI001ED8A989|nr:serine/threonine-protein kinase PLK4 [Ischnura elegans]